MEYVVKNLSDGYIEKYLHSVIDSALSTDIKVGSVKSLIDDVINENKTMDKILSSNEKLSATWNNKGGSITLGQDTLIAEDSRTFEKLFNKVFENRNKLESIVDRICSDRASEISNRVLEKLNNNILEDCFYKKDEKLEKLNKQLDYFKFKSDLEDGLLDSINNEYVGFKVNQKTLETESSNGLTLNLELSYECIGYDNPNDLHEYLSQGYSICSKEDLDKVRGYIYNEVFNNRYNTDSNGERKLKEGIVFR
ncbi:hypothetical protein [Clostridium beijerinckii]|uniref:hypothetical protein n=1 Tax=Clostridium beijerinckii TaxID=1520 RepID=UPI00047E202A|nr:hypothetical protein [Clostridium beijerinckii]